MSEKGGCRVDGRVRASIGQKVRKRKEQKGLIVISFAPSLLGDFGKIPRRPNVVAPH